jgi:hypothetical protein
MHFAKPVHKKTERKITQVYELRSKQLTKNHINGSYTPSMKNLTTSSCHKQLALESTHTLTVYIYAHYL